MKKRIFFLFFFFFALISPQLSVFSAEEDEANYKIGVEDVLSISVIQPEKIENTVVVAPDGTISFPYIGMLKIAGMTVDEVRALIEEKLRDGYMKYPIVTVYLKESKSKKFSVYGEVVKPGTYLMDDNMTVLRAITVAGGFTKFGSTNHVKILRPRKGRHGYRPIKVNIKAVLNGDPSADLPIKSGDIVVVSEGVF